MTICFLEQEKNRYAGEKSHILIDRDHHLPRSDEDLAVNTLYYCDNLPILRHHLAAESVDLIYLDPPFNSNQDYNVLFKEQSG